MMQRFFTAALIMLIATALPGQVLGQSDAPTESPAPSPMSSLLPTKEGPAPTESPAPTPTPSIFPTNEDQFPTESPVPSPTPSLFPSKVGDMPVSSPPVAPPFAPTPIDCGVFPEGACRICGPGKCVTLPDTIFLNQEGDPELPCGQLEEAGREKAILDILCPQLPSLTLTRCGCEPESTPAVTSAPVSPPSAAPQEQDCGYFSNVLCNVCGTGKCVTFPDAVVKIPGQPDYQCGALEEAARTGTISFDNFACPFLPDWTAEPCGCAPPTAPTTTIPPTKSPVPSPTASPVDDAVNFPFDGMEESTESNETLGGGAIFGIVFAACCLVAVGGFLTYKVLQENSIRQTHDRGLTHDPTSTPTKAVPPQSLFLNSLGAVDGDANFMAHGDIASSDPQDGPMDDVPVEII